MIWLKRPNALTRVCQSKRTRTSTTIAMLSKATMYAKLKRFSKAIFSFDELIGMTNVKPLVRTNAHYLKGKSLFELKRYNPAVESYKKVIKSSDITDAVEYESCGDTLILLKRYSFYF